MRKKAGGREKEAGSGTRRASSRANSQRPSRSHSDDEEDEGIPASYHTVSLQVSQDVSTTALFTLLPLMDLSLAIPETCGFTPCLFRGELNSFFMGREDWGIMIFLSDHDFVSHRVI